MVIKFIKHKTTFFTKIKGKKLLREIKSWVCFKSLLENIS